MTTYTIGSIDTRRGGNERPLMRDGDVVAYVDSDAGPAIVGTMTEQQARRRFPDAFRDEEE